MKLPCIPFETMYFGLKLSTGDTVTQYRVHQWITNGQMRKS